MKELRIAVQPKAWTTQGDQAYRLQCSSGRQACRVEPLPPRPLARAGRGTPLVATLMAKLPTETRDSITT
jgi:hypothetical protein